MGQDAQEKLRALFLRTAVQKGFSREVFALDLFAFFDFYRPLSRSDVIAYWNDFLNRPDTNSRYRSLYIHIPFCSRLCVFCQNYKVRHNSLRQTEAYLEELVEEMADFQTVTGRTQFDRLHIGGGTPTVLTEQQLRRLLKEIHDHFVFRGDAVKILECHPADSDRARLQAAVDGGVNKVTFGVQSVSDDVLSAMGRTHQTLPMVRQAVRHAKAVSGLETVNADVMLGWFNDSACDTAAAFEELAGLGTDSILVFPLVPSQAYLETQYGGHLSRFTDELKAKMADFDRRVAPIAQRHGFSFEPLSRAALDIGPWVFLREGQTRPVYERGFLYDCLGLGTGAYSRCVGSAFYYRQDGAEGGDGCAGASLRTYRGCLTMTLDQEKLRFVLESFQIRGGLVRSRYREFFGSDVLDDFAEPMEHLRRRNAVKIGTDTIVLTAREPKERFVDALFFCSDQSLVKALEQMTARSVRACSVKGQGEGR